MCEEKWLWVEKFEGKQKELENSNEDSFSVVINYFTFVIMSTNFTQRSPKIPIDFP